MSRALLLVLLLGCGSTESREPTVTTPTAIGASDALREDEREIVQGFAGAALAQMPEADLTTEEGREVLSFSAASVMTLGTFISIMGGGFAEAAGECFDIQRSEEGGTTRTEVRANGCRGTQPDDEKRYDGVLVLEEHVAECGKSGSLTLRSWTIRDDRACGNTGAPRGFRVYDGRVETDMCQDTMSIDLVLGGEGLEELEGECRPVRRTAIRYELSHVGGEADRKPLSGEGEVGISGAGRALVETDEELMMRDGCSTEAESGITRARAGGHVAEVRYDGATECTDPGRAPLFIDGEPAGTTEHACAAGGSDGAPLVPLLLLLALRRRRS